MRSATALKRLGRIRVGLRGPFGPTMAGYVEALQRSPDYIVVDRHSETGEPPKSRVTPKGRPSLAIVPAPAAIPDPDVDLVAVFSTGEAAVAEARTAMRAGCDVYLHSPLTIGLSELTELHALAQDNNIRHIVGLPRRLSRTIRFAADLVKDGYVGTLQTADLDAETRTSPGLDTVAAWYPPQMAIEAAELLDTMFAVVGWPRLLFGFQAGQGASSGAISAQANKAQIVGGSGWGQLTVAGSLGDEAAFSIRFASRSRSRSAVRIKITGDDGDLVMSNSRQFGNYEDCWRMAGARGSGLVLRPLAVPKSYAWSADGSPAPKSRAILDIFAAFARDLHEVTALAPTLDDAIRLQRLSHAIIASAEGGRRVVV